MSVQVQLRRDTATNIVNAPTGAQGELWVDTTNWRVIVNDNATTGGHPAAKLSEVPVGPSSNGATASFAWVEQAVTLSGSSTTFTLSGMPSYSAILMGISCRVTTAITGTGGISGFGIDYATGGSGYNLSNNIGLTTGTTANGASLPNYVGNSTSLNINAMTSSGHLGGAFAAGVVRVSALVMTILPPTS
ncbi:MAG TPA: hypothetical protein VEK34_13240 [Methylocella sp.]|nr:hypothetical protein [Methylocella sp.]